VMLSLDSVGRHAANDVICEEHNLHQSEVTLLKPWTLPDWHGNRALGNRRPPATSPPVTIIAVRVGVPDHVTATCVARHFCAKETDVFQKLQTQCLVTEQESQEKFRSNTVAAVRQAPVRRGGNDWHVHNATLVAGYNFRNPTSHDVAESTAHEIMCSSKLAHD
jgi:hypothetical protein